MCWCFYIPLHLFHPSFHLLWPAFLSPHHNAATSWGVLIWGFTLGFKIEPRRSIWSHLIRATSSTCLLFLLFVFFMVFFQQGQLQLFHILEELSYQQSLINKFFHPRFGTLQFHQSFHFCYILPADKPLMLPQYSCFSTEVKSGDFFRITEFYLGVSDYRD